MNPASRFIHLVLLISGSLGIPLGVAEQQARAREPEPRDRFDLCMDTGEAARGSMDAMIQCLMDDLDRKDDELNEVYRATRNGLGPAARHQLQVSERRWIAARDKKCLNQAEQDGAGVWVQDSTISWYGCLIGETERRIKWLKTIDPKVSHMPS